MTSTVMATRLKRWLARLTLVISFLIVFTGVFLLYAGKFLASPARGPQKADVIIVLGGDTGARSICGLQLYKQGYAHYILLTGLEEGEQTTQQFYLNRLLTSPFDFIKLLS